MWAHSAGTRLQRLCGRNCAVSIPRAAGGSKSSGAVHRQKRLDGEQEAQPRSGLLQLTQFLRQGPPLILSGERCLPLYSNGKEQAKIFTFASFPYREKGKERQREMWRRDMVALLSWQLL